MVWKGLETIRWLEGAGAPFLLAVGLLLLWWVTDKAGGLGPVLSQPSKFQTTGEFMRFFIPSLTGDGRLLGDGGAEHSRLHAVRAIADATR